MSSCLKLPHPLPYQGSKRSLATLIGPNLPTDIDTWYEPFCGSAAMSIWAIHYRKPRRLVLGDSLAGIADLWRAIIENPDGTAARYAELWSGHVRGPDHFLAIRARYNNERDPVDLLYLTVRCVKNAVRFNAKGNFTQSADHRRKGMRPEAMRKAIRGASEMLRGKTEIRTGDWLSTMANAGKNDFGYLDPPYLGTSTGPDKRYAHQMQQEPLISGLRDLNARGVRFALSYDGMLGGKEYGPPLPCDIGTRLLLHAGVSSQSTLNGKSEQTVESLYLSPGLVKPAKTVVRREHAEAGQSIMIF